MSRGGQAYREPRQNDTSSKVSKDRGLAPTFEPWPMAATRIDLA